MLAEQADLPASEADSAAEGELQVAPADETPNGIAELEPWSPPPFELSWVELETAAQVDLSGSMATVRLINPTDEAVEIELTLLGDRGTTRTYASSLGEVTLEAGATQAVPVDLELLIGGQPMSYAGVAHVKARVRSAETTEELAAVMTPPLYFHPVGASLRAYDHVQHHQVYRSGDFAALHPDAEVQDTDDFAVDRVVAYEPLPTADLEAQESKIALQLAAEADDAEQPSPSDLAGSTADEGELGSALPAVDALAAQPDTQASYIHRLCVRFEVDTTDSGFTNSVGITEDVWSDGNDSPAYPASRGRVDVGSTTLDLDDNGCTIFVHPFSSVTLNVRVYAFTSDSNGNLARVHDGAQTWTGIYPGDPSAKTYSIYVGSTVFHSSYPTYVNVGNHSALWTAVATWGKSLLRYADGISNTQFHLAEGTSCTSAYNHHNDVTNNRSYVYIPGYGCNNGVHLRSKFLAAHEFGHGYLHQYSNRSDTQPRDPDAVAAPNCWNGGTGDYRSWTQEYSSQAFVEGYAHFVAARVWNYKDSDGKFRFGSDPKENTDLERWNSTNDPGGWLVNVCCPNQSTSCVTTQIDGHGIIFDWLRALWDAHTAPSGTNCSLSKSGMALMYMLTITQSGLTDEGFWAATKYAFSWDTACYTYWLDVGCHNGIDREGQPWTGSC